MNLIDWPDCVIKNCRHKCCLRLKSNMCYPHTVLWHRHNRRMRTELSYFAKQMLGKQVPEEHIRVYYKIINPPRSTTGGVNDNRRSP